MTLTGRIKIKGEMKMADAIMINERLLLIIERFDISLGFGQKTISDICTEQQINKELLLIIMNAYNDSSFASKVSYHGELLPGLLNYLRNGHRYYLCQKLPYIKQLIEKFIENTDNKNTLLLRDFFDEYAKEVEEHMTYENNTVFPYLEKLYETYIEKGANKQSFRIQEFISQHTNIMDKPEELKNLLVKHFPPTKDRFYRNLILLELFDLESDLADHSRLEEQLLAPLANQIEEIVKSL